MTDQGKPAGSVALDVTCPLCLQSEGEPCRTASGLVRQAGREHAVRWEKLRAEYAQPRRYVLKDDDERFGLSAGDVLVCRPYWLDSAKLTVMYRERDGFDPQCNVYRPSVERVRGAAGKVDRAAVPA